MSNEDIEYQPDAKYVRGVKDEWISMEQFLTKDRILELTDIVGQLVAAMRVRGTIGGYTAAMILKQVKELKEEIVKK